MKNKLWRKLIPPCFVLILLSLACSFGGKTIGTIEPLQAEGTITLPTEIPPLRPTEVPATEVPTAEIPEVDLPHPIPAAGKGNLTGQVRWNEVGAAGISLKICTEFSWFGGCKGTIYSATTDDFGIYIFQDVDPGQYALTLKAFDSDRWLYMTTGLLSERMYTVTAGDTTEVGVSDIYKMDLKAMEPADNATVSESRPVIKWEAYPDATSYELFLNPQQGDAVAVSEKINTNEYTPPNDLFNCEYTWKVEAYNKYGTKITEMDKYRDFTVTGATYSCTIKVLKPLSNATVPSSGIELEWEAHPLADYYKLFMWPEDDSSNHILDFIEVRGTTYTITDTLPPGKYVLSVDVYDANNKHIAGSKITYLIVK